MFTLDIPATSSAVDAIKAELTRTLAHVKSSHRCEAFARGLGFRTYASLLIATRSPTLATAKGATFSAYLAAHGFNVPPLSFYRAVARVALRAVLDKVPNLTMWGIGTGRPQRKLDGKFETSREQYARFLAEREALVSDHAIEPFLLSLACLANVKRTKTIRPGGSYWIKHIAENYACTYPEGEKLGPRYVANGALIAAAVHAGFEFKTYVDHLGYDAVNVSFNMSKVALEDLDCRVRPTGAIAQSRRHRAEMRQYKSIYASVSMRR